MSTPLGSVSPKIVDHLAELTRHRDRELLDVTLAGAFRSLLAPLSVAIYRKVGQPGDERWTMRARLGQTEALASSDPPWIELDDLPRLSDCPARCDALNGQTVTFASGGRCFSVFPIATDRDVVGVLELETRSELGDEARRIVDSVLLVYRNFETLLDYSERDMLTGLLNRKTFDDAFLKIATSKSSAVEPHPHERRRCPRPQDPHFVAMIDIDFFKSVNDKFGHLIGDEVLLLQSRLMRSSFRFQDRLYRFGGEEFVVLMQCADAASAAGVVERLRSNTASFAFPQAGQVTVSIGFTQVRPGDSPSAALGRADQAVYFAKGHGRNQAQQYEDLVARGLLKVVGEQVGEIDLF
jgi:diguanylate cyclase (GGDEF)-like protein